MITFSVVIPTIGRETIVDTLQSCQDLTRADEIIIVHDGVWPGVTGVVDLHHVTSRYDRFKGGLKCPIHVTYWDGGQPTAQEKQWGRGPRTTGMRMAERSHLLFMDDDDAYIPGALEAARQWVEKDPQYLHFFGLVYPEGKVLPQGTQLKVGNVSSQMGIVPNLPTRLGKWGPEYNGDHAFYASCQFPLLWHPDIILCRIKPRQARSDPQLVL